MKIIEAVMAADAYPNHIALIGLLLVTEVPLGQNMVLIMLLVQLIQAKPTQASCLYPLHTLRVYASQIQAGDTGNACHHFLSCSTSSQRTDQGPQTTCQT